MAGLPQNQRDQVMLVVGIVGLALAGAYYYFLFMPKAEEFVTTRAHIERLDASNQRAKALLARGTVEELRAEAQRLQDNLSLMRTLIPAENEVPALLDQIVGAARRTGLEVQSFSPSATVSGEEFDTQRYAMNMNGTYHEIAELLTAIGSLRRIITPVNLRLQPLNVANPRPMPADQRLLSASFDLQTYVAKTAGSGATP
jgi:Tfp pilus assembly protein PilO